MIIVFSCVRSERDKGYRAHLDSTRKITKLRAWRSEERTAYISASLISAISDLCRIGIKWHQILFQSDGFGSPRRVHTGLLKLNGNHICCSILKALYVWSLQKKLNMVFYSLISLHGYYLSICGRAISLKPFGSKEDRPAFYKKKERKHCASVWLVKRKWKRMVGLVSRSLWFDGGDCQEKKSWANLGVRIPVCSTYVCYVSLSWGLV